MSAVMSDISPAVELAATRNPRQAAPIPESRLQPHVDSARYARCVEVSKRIRWEIDRDVLRQRHDDSATRHTAGRLLSGGRSMRVLRRQDVLRERNRGDFVLRVLSCTGV